MKIHIEENMPNVYHVRIHSQYWLTMTFMRMSEFSESGYKALRGKYFSFEKCMDTYAKYQGNFRYATDTAGFNVPGDRVTKFFDLFIANGDLTLKERKLYAVLRPLIEKHRAKKTKFYVIATYHDEDLDHEIAHSLFYLNPRYKERMLELINPRLKLFREMRRAILKEGYHRDAVVDEIQAYLSEKFGADREFFLDAGIKLPPEVQKEFRKVFNRFTKRWRDE